MRDCVPSMGDNWTLEEDFFEDIELHFSKSSCIIQGNHEKAVNIMALMESGEMYLETILILSRKKPYVRAVDIGDYMGYSKPSISRAMGLLRKGGYVEVNPDGHITLTDAGREVAETIYERHNVLTDILTSLGVDPDIAVRDACKMEHYISDVSFQALKRHFAAT